MALKQGNNIRAGRPCPYIPCYLCSFIFHLSSPPAPTLLWVNYSCVLVLRITEWRTDMPARKIHRDVLGCMGGARQV